MSRKRLACTIFLVACRARPSVDPDAGASIAPPPTTATPAAITPDAGEAEARLVLGRWDSAHQARDASALAPLYAPTVAFYAVQLSNAECVKRKSDAFAKAPDYTQKLEYVHVERVPGEPKQNVTFVKTSIANRKKITVASMIVVDDTLHIVEETDVVTHIRQISWCIDAHGAITDAIIPPYRVSAVRVARELEHSKRVKALRAAQTTYAINVQAPLFCPAAPCKPGENECGYFFRGVLQASEPEAIDGPDVWDLYVDPETNVLHYRDDSGAWANEPL